MNSAASETLALVREALKRWPRPEGHALVVGLCGAQGSGKSTLCAALEAVLRSEGEVCITVGLDDYYLCRAERAALARGVHPLLTTRGPPGTHDIEALTQTLDALRQGERVRLRCFEKAADDVAPDDSWPEAPPGATLVLLEGWCVGAAPQAEADLRRPQNALEAQDDSDGGWRSFVNAALAGPYQALFAKLDRLILLRPPGFEIVHAWRAQQERTTAEAAAAQGLSTSALMDEAALGRFIQHYERLTRAIIAEMPNRADLTIQLDEIRRPVSAQNSDGF